MTVPSSGGGGGPAGPVVGAGAVVLDDASRLLVVRRGRAPQEGRWTLPGGRVELGETLREAVAREVAEETALEVEVGELVGVTESIGDGSHLVIVDFRARVVAGVPEAGDDAAALAWMGRGELEEAGTTTGLLDFLDAHGVRLAP